MSCENLLIPKPITGQCPTGVFGIPFGASGRVVANTAYEIQGIVLHCYPGTVSQLCNELKCKTKTSIISGSSENSYHYGVGATGNISQFVQDCDISWAFGAYKNNSYATVPPPNTAINWPTLQAANGLNTTPDVYVLNVAIALGHQVAENLMCYNCPTASGLPQDQHDELVQLLAYLAQEYEIVIDSEHIQFHDLMRCDETESCPCTDIETLLGEVVAYCPPCEGDEAPAAPEAQPDDVVNYIMGITEACCPNSLGCYVKIPWNGCFIGDMAVDGTLDSYILGLSQDPITEQWCLTRGCLGVTSPIIGCGTVDDPLRLSRCAFGAWMPDEPAENMLRLVGLDVDGCLIDSPVEDVVQLYETPITPVDTLTIDLSVSGQSDHTLQADLIVSQQAGNQVEVLADGVFVDFDCDDVNAVFNTEGVAQFMLGFDDQGLCVKESVVDVVSEAICEVPEDLAMTPTGILARDVTTCPAYVTPEQVVAAGFATADSDCIDVDWTNNILSIDPIVSPAANNIFECTPSGMFVPDLVVAGNDACVLLDYTSATRTLVASLVIAPAQGGITNQLSCISQQGAFVPRGADALVSGPLTGNGSDLDPIDIDFSLLDAQDLCDFGDSIPVGSLVDLIGRDGAGCLRRQTPQDVVGDVLVANDTSCIDLTLVGTTLTADPIISGPQGGFANALVCTPTGLYVPVGSGMTPVNTDCVNISITVPGLISSTLNFNPSGDNQVSCTPTGLYVPPAAGLSVLDTDCINLTLVGGVLTAAPILAGPQGGIPNVLNCLPGQGFYVPEAAGLAVTDTSCVDLDLTGGVLTATVIIDPTGDNQVQCLPSGLYVPPAAGLNALDTDCISLNLAAGTNLTATPILAGPQAGCANALQCLGDGLYVQTLNFVDTDCFNFSVIGCNVTLEPIIDPDVCNGVECRNDGLYVNNDIHEMSIADPQLLQNLGAIAINAGQKLDIGRSLLVQLTNPSTCNNMAMFVNANGVAIDVQNTGLATVVLVGGYDLDDNGTGRTTQTLTNITATLAPGQTLTIPAQSFGYTNAEIGPGATYTFEIFPFLESVAGGNFTGNVVIRGINLQLRGLNYIR